MLKKLKWLLFALLSWSLISCAPKPPDIPACEHMGQRVGTDPATGHTILKPSPTCEKSIGEAECGHCVYIVSGKEIFVGDEEKNHFNGKPWSKLRAESVYLPAEESYSPLAKYIINACKKMNCSDDVNRFKVKLDSLGSLSNVSLD